MRFLKAVLCVTVLSAVLAPTSALGAAQAPPTQIELISVTVSEKSNDIGPKGPSTGDRSFGASKLINASQQFGKKRGAVVGSDTGWFTFTSKTTVRASGVTKLPGGTITFRGPVSVSQGIMAIPVVSGTGVFAGARGTLYVGSTGKKNEAVNVYKLSYSAVA